MALLIPPNYHEVLQKRFMKGFKGLKGFKELFENEA